MVGLVQQGLSVAI